MSAAPALGTITVDDQAAMAAIVADLVREGVTFEVVQDTAPANRWIITLTGGH